LDRAGVTVGGLVVNKRVPIGMGEFLEERRSQEEKHLKLLEKELPELARHDLFLVSQDVVGLNALEKLAKDL